MPWACRTALSSVTIDRALLLALVLGAACGEPPRNDPRFWDGRQTRPPVPRDSAPAEGEGTGGAQGAGGIEGGAGGDDTPGTGGGATGMGAGTGGASSGGGAGGAGRPMDASAARDTTAVDLSMPGPAAGCALEVTVTTATTNRDYRPRNIGAIWIADATNRFVKTLAVWGNRRASHLVRWNQVTSAAGLPASRVDAISGATAGSHVAHPARWDCTDTRRMTVATGSYRLCMEMTESNSTPTGTPTQQSCIQFSHAGQPWQLMPPDEPNFKMRSLRYEPR